MSLGSGETYFITVQQIIEHIQEGEHAQGFLIAVK